MNIVVTNTNFEVIYILDSYESLIWVDRYYEAGDFELYTPLNFVLLNYLKEGYYLQIQASTKTMIIEKIQVTSDFDGGSHLIISGRSLESIIDRRVLYPKTEVSGKLHTIIKKWMNDTIINPTQAVFGKYYKLRKMDNFKFQDSTDTAVTKIEVPKKDFTGTNLYNAIVEYCKANYIGFQIALDNDNKFVFSLYAGSDRSAEQTKNRLVLFSKNYGNILSSDFYSDSKDFKNFVILVAGSGDKEDVRYFGNTTAIGMKHREHYYSCSLDSISGSSQYESDINYYGNLEVYHNGRKVSVTAEVDFNNTQFVYGIDYFLGDLVQVESEITEGQARITEYTINVTESGIEYYPTFEFVPIYNGGDE